MDEGSPSTIADAIERFMSQDWSESDDEVIMNTPVQKLDWLHANFEPTIRRVCGLDKGNTPLLRACGGEHLTPHEASRVIMEKIWHYWRTGIVPE